MLHVLSIAIFLLWVLALGRTLFNLALLPRLRQQTPVGEPLVSVIIPARDEARVIAATIRAFLASTYRNFELIVVDDRSTDGTGAAARAFDDPRL
ncbi:MAG TPA: glycosyltransferase, partial [Candidatus Dormibacteraeota bacterium]